MKESGSEVLSNVLANKAKISLAAPSVHAIRPRAKYGIPVLCSAVWGGARITGRAGGRVGHDLKSDAVWGRGKSITKLTKQNIIDIIALN